MNASERRRQLVKVKVGHALSAALKLWGLSTRDLASDVQVDEREIEAMLAGQVGTIELKQIVELFDYVAAHIDAPMIGNGETEPAVQRVEAWLQKFADRT